MRFFVFILSVLILFQPSWAMPMSAHQHMDDAALHDTMQHGSQQQSQSPSQSPQSLMASTAQEHCLQEAAEHSNLAYSTTEQADITDAADTADAAAACLINCLIACAAAPALLSPAATASQVQYTDVTYLSRVSHFTSHTESPEIRPPHSVHS